MHRYILELNFRTANTKCGIKLHLHLEFLCKFQLNNSTICEWRQSAAAPCFKVRTAWLSFPPLCSAIAQFNVSIYSRVFLQKLCTCNTLQPARPNTSKLTLPALHSYLPTHARHPFSSGKMTTLNTLHMALHVRWSVEHLMTYFRHISIVQQHSEIIVQHTNANSSGEKYKSSAKWRRRGWSSDEVLSKTNLQHVGGIH